MATTPLGGWIERFRRCLGPAVGRRCRHRPAFEVLEDRQLLAGDLAITEWMAKNATVLTDSDGDTPDWIELHNGGSEPVSLEGWSLTDTPDLSHRWHFPLLRLDPDAYLIVFASGKDRAVDGVRLTSDFHATPDGTFLVDLPEGDYTVRLTLGDAARVRDDVVIELQGDRVDTLTTGAGEFAARQYRATVGPATGGQLAVRLIDLGGETGRASIDAMTITPLAGGETLRFDFDAARPRTEPGFVSVVPADMYTPQRGYGWQEGTTLSSQDRGLEKDEPHTDFKLSAGGEYLALVSPDGSVVSEYGEGGVNYPQQRTDVSYGATPDGPRYFATPTPGAPNADGWLGWVTDPAVSVDHGFYDQPQVVDITTSSPGAVIYVTTDGSVPDPANPSAARYSGPMTIASTTVLRAAAFRDGYLPSRVQTRSYLFIEDVIRQDFESTVAAGLPPQWGAGAEPDYGLDPDVVGLDGQDLFGGAYAAAIRGSLRAIPSVSVVMNSDDLFGINGINAQPERSGAAWERPTSVELIRPDGSDGFQIDAGIRIQGGAFRSLSKTKKKSFRLVFKDKYGDGKLNYPFFGEDAAQQFDTITLRMEANDGWQWAGANSQPLYVRDEYVRRTQLAMGQPAPHGNHVHLYINGVYWGLYNAVERPDQSFGASYFGAEKSQWDGINSGDPPSLRNVVNAEDDIDRQRRAINTWNTMIGLTEEVANAPSEAERSAALQRLEGNLPDGTPDPTREDFLDVENLIDYMILNFYAANVDWPHHNYYVGRENSPRSTGFKFFSWDAEWTFFLGSGLDTNLLGVDNGVAVPYQNLLASEEFRIRFGDRVHRHFFNGGALYVDPEHPAWDAAHPERNVPAARFVAATEEIFDAIVAESARWGDQHRELPYSRDVEWQAERERVLNEWFPHRSAILLDQFRQAGLYPHVEAPRFNQHGGRVAKSFPLQMTAPPGGVIYYTLDGTDPRQQGGGISTTAIPYRGDLRLDASASVMARRLVDGEWSALNAADFTVISNLPLRITEMNVQPHDANLVPGLGERNVGNDRFEFVELMNVGDEPIELGGVSLAETQQGDGREGIAFVFGSQTLDPGERTVIARDRLAFASRYGSAAGGSLATGDDGQGGPNGEYGGKLANSGERIVLLDAEGITIQDFTYGSGGSWPARAAGGGSSYQVIDPSGDYSDPDNWRSSHAFGGSPFQDDLAGDHPVVINEIIARAADAESDQLEIANLTGSPVDVGGWYLSGADGDLFQARLPTGTSIPANRYRTVALAEVGFDIDGLAGGHLQLIEVDGSGRPRRFADRVAFRGSEPGTALGRWPDGGGANVLFPMAHPTLGAANDGPAAGEVILSEVHYHPPAFTLFTHDFGRGTAKGFTPLLGTWQVVDGRYRATPVGQSDALATIAAAGAMTNRFRISATLQLPEESELERNAALIFDYRGPDDFKFASADAASGDWRMGQRDADGWHVLHHEDGTIVPGQDIDVTLEIVDTTAILRVGGAERIRYHFGTPLGGTPVGIGTQGGEALFDNVVLEQLEDPEDFEFVELVGPEDRAVDLSGWQLAGDVQWQFAAGTTLAPGEALVVVGFDPVDGNRTAALQGILARKPDVRLAGPYHGRLGNEGGVVELVRPLAAEDGVPPGSGLVDRVAYQGAAPWPTAADGRGASLHRVTADTFGGLPQSYRPLPPSPGQEPFVRPGDLDLNGRVDTGDIDGLVLALTDPAAYEAAFDSQAELGGDLDLDGDVDFDDIAQLVAILRGTAAATGR